VQLAARSTIIRNLMRYEKSEVMFFGVSRAQWSWHVTHFEAGLLLLAQRVCCVVACSPQRRTCMYPLLEQILAGQRLGDGPGAAQVVTLFLNCYNTVTIGCSARWRTVRLLGRLLCHHPVLCEICATRGSGVAYQRMSQSVCVGCSACDKVALT
jgi:hypothetical protein